MAITINDLPKNQALDRKSMSSIRGAGGAGWVINAFPAFPFATNSIVPVVNMYQLNSYVDNSIHAGQIFNQSLSVNNSGENSTITNTAVLISSKA